MNEKLLYLLIKTYHEGNVTPEIKIIVESYFDKISSDEVKLDSENEEIVQSKIWGNICLNIKKRENVYYYNFKRLLAASFIISLLGLGSYLFVFNQKNEVQKNLHTQITKKEIRPANGNVILTLGNGEKVVLDSLGDGKLALGDNINVDKSKGSLIYGSDSKPSISTLSTEKGKNFHLVLSDGSQVWLDATSSLKFPTVFIGKDRTVELKGQAYFEIAHNAKRPFKVKVGENLVEVLGTHFNVNDFSDKVMITLLEGSVKASSANQSVKLKPNEQAQISKSKIIINHPDINEIIAWKNGYFKFSNRNIEEISNTLSRWYDVDFIFKSSIPNSFVIEISKNESLSRVLELIEMTHTLHFKVDGKKIIVTN